MDEGMKDVDETSALTPWLMQYLVRNAQGAQGRVTNDAQIEVLKKEIAFLEESEVAKNAQIEVLKKEIAFLEESKEKESEELRNACEARVTKLQKEIEEIQEAVEKEAAAKAAAAKEVEKLNQRATELIREVEEAKANEAAAKAAADAKEAAKAGRTQGRKGSLTTSEQRALENRRKRIEKARQEKGEPSKDPYNPESGQGRGTR